MKIYANQLKRIIQEETRSKPWAFQTASTDAEDETGRTMKLSSENAAAVEKAKSLIEEQLNSLYHNQMLENSDLIAILEQMIKDINSGFVGEPT